MLEGEYNGIKYKKVESGFQIRWPNGLKGFVPCENLEEFKKIIDDLAQKN